MPKLWLSTNGCTRFSDTQDKGYEYLAEHYTSARSYDILMKHL